MNFNAKSQYFNWLVAAAVVLLLVVGIAQTWQGAPELRPHRQLENAHSANESWEANSLVPETRLIPDPMVKLSPVPPLQREKNTIEFAPLQQVERIKTRELPRIDKIATHPLPDFPATPAHDAPASYQESILADPSNNRASGDGQPAMQFAPLPQISRIETRELPPMKGIVTHALPELPVAPQQELSDEMQTSEPVVPKKAESVGESTGEDAKLKIRALPPQKDIKFKDLPIPPVDDQSKIDQPETTE